MFTPSRERIECLSQPKRLPGGAFALENLIGIPYKFKGRGFDGVDCLGLVWLYFRSKGISFPDGDGLPIEEEAGPDYLKRALDALNRIARPVSEPQADDIVVMRFPGGYVHLGVMVDQRNMLHVVKGRPSSVTPLWKFRFRIVGIYRLIAPNRGSAPP
ncbi:MAG: C40 family peptidase [Firmicutes bacterium]|nr:C40 family peptidase [Candidatus Fermentithermobacillaceae bacterium]